MAKAFVAKSVYKFETTDILIEYLKEMQKYQAAVRMGTRMPKYHPAQRSLGPLQSSQHTACRKKFTKQWLKSIVVKSLPAT